MKKTKSKKPRKSMYNKPKTFAIISLVFGILSVVFMIIPYVGMILAVISAWFVVSIEKVRSYSIGSMGLALAITGFILNLIISMIIIFA